jgi:hypothetical protein
MVRRRDSAVSNHKMRTQKLVMTGLVPGIHVFLIEAARAWMAGTSPAMTTVL